MSSLSKAGLRRSLLALTTFAAVSALLAAPALAEHEHYGGGFWFPPIPRIFVPFPPPFVVVAGPHGHGCDYHDDHYYYDDDHRHHYHYYDGGYGHGDRGDYRGEWRHHGRGHPGRGHRGYGGYRD